MVRDSAWPGPGLGISPSFSTKVSASGQFGTGPSAKVQYRFAPAMRLAPRRPKLRHDLSRPSDRVVTTIVARSRPMEAARSTRPAMFDLSQFIEACQRLVREPHAPRLALELMREAVTDGPAVARAVTPL